VYHVWGKPPHLTSHLVISEIAEAQSLGDTKTMTQSAPKISIVTVSYNQGKFIREEHSIRSCSELS